jgi:hypothetical protein
MSAQLAPLAITEFPEPASPGKPAKPQIVPPAQTTPAQTTPAQPTPAQSDPAQSDPKESRPKQSRPANSRHARRCTICHHENLLQIEDDFLHWRPATEIAAEYALPDRRVVYRHARAAGLYRRRMRNMRRACSHIAEHAERVTPNAKNVLDAIRYCVLIDDDGVWHEPTQRVIVEHVNAPQPPHESAAANPDPSAATTPETATSNVHSTQLESAATPTKQTPPPASNVYSHVKSPGIGSYDWLVGLGLFPGKARRSVKIDPAALERSR